MKYILSFFSIVGLVLVFVFVGVKPTCQEENSDYLRVHIRANSNSIEDQKIKYMVRDAVVEAMIPILSEVQTKQQAEVIVRKNFQLIEDVANEILLQNGFSYNAHARISNEYFPTKTYENLTLKDGFYDALILDLGSGAGNNWWCVIYPAFCFLKTTNNSNSVYISKIWEIIKSVTK